MSISPRYVTGIELRIRELNEQVENARQVEAEAAMKLGESLIKIGTLEQQLAALAEQNEKMRDALLYSKKLQDFAKIVSTGAQDRELSKMEPVLYKLTVEALSLPDLATPVLNRIRSEGMRMAADICSEPGVNAWFECQEAIRAKVDELEKQNG